MSKRRPEEAKRKSPLSNLIEWTAIGSEYEDWVSWSALNADQRWGIANKSPGGLEGGKGRCVWKHFDLPNGQSR